VPCAVDCRDRMNTWDDLEINSGINCNLGIVIWYSLRHVQLDVNYDSCKTAAESQAVIILIHLREAVDVGGRGDG